MSRIFLYFSQDSIISSLNGKSLNVVEQLTELGSSISFTESDVNIGKAWTATERLTKIWKYKLSDKIF